MRNLITLSFAKGRPQHPQVTEINNKFYYHCTLLALTWRISGLMHKGVELGMVSGARLKGVQFS